MKKKHVDEFFIFIISHLQCYSTVAIAVISSTNVFEVAFILFLILTQKTCLSTDQSELSKMMKKRVLKNKAKHQKKKESEREGDR